MADEGDQFYVEPQQQHVRQIQQLQLPAHTYDTTVVLEQQKKVAIKMLQIVKQVPYQYKRFKFDKKVQQAEQQQDELYCQQYQSPFTQFYCAQQLVYKKSHNESIARHKQTYYFSGKFIHQNIFTSNEFSQNTSFQDIIKEFYQIGVEHLPQDKIAPADLRFDSGFQSGNLFAAFKISALEYDLVMEMDTNSRGNTQWFYFSVENMAPGRQYTFNIVNFTKNDSLFNYGMEPAVYSQIQAQKSKDHQKVWKRMGLQVSYKKGRILKQNSRRPYYTLSFKLISKHSGDKLFIAHSYPYTLSKLNDFMYQKCLQHKQLVSRIVIGKTLSKKPLQALKIAVPLKKKDLRKAIIILARQHPGQTQGSFVCQGVIEKILAKTKEAQSLRKNYVFYVVPMVNVDGVVNGHYRTNLAGKDLNRKWDSTEKQTATPEVNAIKAFLAEISKERQIRFVLDLHGHSKKLNSFFYGNPCPQNPQVVRIYPYVCSKLSQAIQFYDCTFSCEQYKRKAARVYLSFLYKLLHVYTFQSSFYAYFKDGKKIQFTPKQYRDLGGTLIQGLMMQLEHQVKFQQSFQFNALKNTSKQYLNSPFVKMLNQLKQNKNLLEIGNQLTSGSDSKPDEGQINDMDIIQVKQMKLTRPPSLSMPQEPKSIRLSRKGQRQVKQIIKPIRNMRFLQISKINSVLPDKYQLCLQPIKLQSQIKMNQTLKTSMSTILKQSSQCQTQRDRQQIKYKQMKKTQIQSCMNLSNSVKFQVKQIKNSNQRRYSSVIRNQNRNNIIFKIDFLTQQTRQQKPSTKKPAKILKHAFSQTVISFNTQRQKQKQKQKQANELVQQRLKNSQVYLPNVDSPDHQRKFLRNNQIKYDTVRIGTKRQAELFLNGVVKKYFTEKQQPKHQPLSIFTKALERPKSLRRK